jgi:hypothetical protein
MTGNTFAPEVARAVELIRSGIDPHELRRQVHREHGSAALRMRRSPGGIGRGDGMTVIRAPKCETETCRAGLRCGKARKTVRSARQAAVLSSGGFGKSAVTG